MEKLCKNQRIYNAVREVLSRADRMFHNAWKYLEMRIDGLCSDLRYKEVNIMLKHMRFKAGCEDVEA